LSASGEKSNMDLPRILIVDDEEAILETMTFTFMDVYEVITATDAHRALDLIDEHAPISVVITDQRMPEMTGVELLEQIYQSHPDTVRIMLTGFADSEATIRAINEGHVYAYINKPWEPEELKQVVKRAVEHHDLAVENRRLLAELQSALSVMQAVMDRLDVGAIALDRDGVVRAFNEPARAFLGLGEDVEGQRIQDILRKKGLDELCVAVERLAEEQKGGFEDHDLPVGSKGHRVRLSSQDLNAPGGEHLGRVFFIKEISHEPLRREFEQLVARISHEEGSLREPLEAALRGLTELASRVGATGVASPGMGELAERVSRSRTAVENWLDVDDVLAREEYPDAQMLIDRLRVASQRWPYVDELPARVRELHALVEAYYESGENPGKPVL
jgi:CheY-like chemotaxis protein